jgi:hypothetical protein
MWVANRLAPATVSIQKLSESCREISPELSVAISCECLSYPSPDRAPPERQDPALLIQVEK